jgi:predicted DNA-binding transcriptional regulator AlpA
MINEQVEVIDFPELAKRLRVSESWIRLQVQPSRTRDPLPHLRLGRKTIRFWWGSSELDAWIRRRLTNGRGDGSRRVT